MAEWFVDNSVGTTGDGSIGSPFKTIQEGMNAAAAGDTVSLRGTAELPGQTYSETVTFPINGTAANHIALRAYPPEKVILTGTTGTRLNINKNYWDVVGLIIDQNNITADAVKINGNFVLMQNCEVKNGQREGISIELAQDVTIEDCNIHDFFIGPPRADAHGIMLDTGVSSTIQNIMIRRTTMRRCSGDGCQIFAVTGQAISTYAKNVSFIDCTFVDGTASGSGETEGALDFKGVDGCTVRGCVMSGYTNNKTIVVQKGCRNVTIKDSEIRDGLSGIECRVEGGASFEQLNQRFEGNVIHDMTSYALKFDGVKDSVVYNNTFADISAQSFLFDNAAIGTGFVNGAIRNNLAYNCGAPSGTANISGATVDHNGWFQAASTGMSSGSDVSDTDPKFVDLASNDFHLNSQSPCRNVGIDIGRDFNGSAPDLGAFEFALPVGTFIGFGYGRLCGWR